MIEERTKEALDWLRSEYQSIRTGQATPALLDSIKVEAYGSRLPIQQVANVGVEDARTLRIVPWDTTLAKTVEQAIADADLGLSVSTDSSGLRVSFPELTGERRQQLIKAAKQKLEDARVSVRSARDEAMKEIDAREKAGTISEDQRYQEREQIQKVVDEANKTLESLYEQKEKEISQ